MFPPTSAAVPLLFGSVAIGVSAAILAWRARPNPGAMPLVWLLAGQSWWSTCIVFSLSAGTAAEAVFWTRVGWVGVMTVPVAWILFSLEYTGRDEYLTRRNVALLAVIPALTVALALTEEYHGLLYVREVGVTARGSVLVEQGGIWYVVAAGYTYLLAVLGIVPILGLLSSGATAFRGQSAALIVGVVTPWATNVLYNLGAFPNVGIDPTPIAFAISGVAYLGAIDRFRMFGANPAPAWRAKQFLFDHIHEGVVVVDGHDTIVEMNRAAAETLEVDVKRAVGSRGTEMLPLSEPFRTDGERELLTVGTGSASRSYDVGVSELTDRHGGTLGYVFTLHDVTRYLQQQQRLKVLNRVLRHNIRTETNIIQGYAERTSGETAETITQRTARIVEISEKGRDAIDLFEDTVNDRGGTSLVGLLERSLDDARDAFPAVEFELEYPAEDAAVSEGLSVVLNNLIENAALHNDGEDRRVTVTAELDDDRARLRVVDNGPGIDDYELDVLNSGTETPLRHASGLGLWLVKWGTEVIDGSVTFESNDPTGTVVTATVPVRRRGVPDHNA
ncbi:histidine kinase N-terminal 7TM domain-containing protein [Halorubrum aethiopicum]|uniref:histidine kinase N-terminal 7TM domain-containing protein n=1 Tax=Halorubrum aethiopicum TaxID=1758255 RepID=UPI0008329CD5|nr:histidine kinase N-terminal 7TM domain-containing protein [Halorubrum aethiopicum]